MTSRLVMGLLLGAMLPAVLLGQSDDAAAKSGAAATNFSVPEIPAFNFLAATPSKIARPNGARAIGAALLEGVDENGRTKQGFALELLPVLQFFNISLADYRNHWRSRFLANLQLSLGTAKASGDSADTDVGVGLRTTLFDQGDLLSDTLEARIIDSLTDKCAPTNPDDQHAKATSGACYAAILKAEGDKWTKVHWNKASLIAAAATGTQLQGSRFGDRRWLGLRAWLTGGFPIGGKAMGLVHAAFDENRVNPDSGYRALTLGGRLLFGGSSVNGFAEGLYQHRSGSKAPAKANDVVWSSGIEFAAAKDLWISTGFGKAFEAVKAPDKVFLFANIKWGVSGKSRLGVGG